MFIFFLRVPKTKNKAKWKIPPGRSQWIGFSSVSVVGTGSGLGSGGERVPVLAGSGSGRFRFSFWGRAEVERSQNLPGRGETRTNQNHGAVVLRKGQARRLGGVERRQGGGEETR